MVDKKVLQISPIYAILISIFSLIISWFIYDFLCKSKLIDNNGKERLPAPSMPQIELGDGAASATVAHSSSGAEAMGNSKTISSSEILPPSVAVATSLGADATIESLDSGSSTDRCIRLGICAMDKKARSKPMGEILSRLDETLFEVVFFGDDLILNGNIEDWPLCDVLIAFYSSGYPLAKAEEYVKLRKPFEVNDLAMQWKLKDRRTVYDLLESSGIDVPRHVYMSRDGYVSTGSGDGEGGNGELIEQDDHVEINSVVINKPFVDVILTNFNKEDYVEESILSVINQTYKNWKLYIIEKYISRL